MRAVIESIRARPDARYSPPEPKLTTEQSPYYYEQFDDVELLELKAAFRELQLFAGAAEWRLRAPSEQVLLEVPGHADYPEPAKRLLDLTDGSFLAYVTNRAEPSWSRCVIRLHERDLEPQPQEMSKLDA